MGLEVTIQQEFFKVVLPVANISDIDTTGEDGDHGSIWALHLPDPDADILEISGNAISDLKELLPKLKSFMPVQDRDYWVNVDHLDTSEDGIDDSDPESWEVYFKSGNGFTLEDDDLERFVKLANIPCEDV